MQIDHNFSQYVVFIEDAILIALSKISAARFPILFAVNESGYLEGVLTRGDLNRWLSNANDINFDTPVSVIVNRNFTSANVNSPPSMIAKLFGERIDVIPLVDDNNRLVAIASASYGSFDIEHRRISKSDPSFIIAEIGNNHQGDIAHAKTLIDRAVDAGADCAKFQMRDLKTLYKQRDKGDISEDLGSQYTLDLLDRFQLSEDDLFRAFDYCRDRGIIPLCTPWDVESLFKLESYGCSAYKVASADFTNYDLIREISRLSKPIICSTGMASEVEIVSGIQKLKEFRCPFALLHCNSTYPAPFKDINLNYLKRLETLSGGIVGYSGHERDINVAIASVPLGARIIEKHFTLNRMQEGNDHKVSLLPDEFKRMVVSIRQVEEALGNDSDRVISQGELMNRETLAKSLIAAEPIPSGTIITEEMITVRSPGQGLQPNRKGDLIGRRLTGAKEKGDFFFESDIRNEVIKAQNFSFPIPWGIPVRYHDFQKLTSMSNMDLVEIHFSYKDLDVDFRNHIDGFTDLDLVVHAPELFKGDHTLDLCSNDSAYRARSISELQRVIDVTRELKPLFKTSLPPIVTNVGGFSSTGHVSADRRNEMMDILRCSLSQLDTAGVEIIPQTMPPFPWHFGGQQYHNLFVDPQEIARFCENAGVRICLDTSHSYLACTYSGIDFEQFVKTVAPYTVHMHLADAQGVDGEGLQIDEGDIDWTRFWEIISETNVLASFIPEIWQGHKNNGEGAWRALERLKAHVSE